jgi:hypothetical protein
MFDFPITLIVGAGASTELGLPAGAALQKQICQLFGSGNPKKSIAQNFRDEISRKDAKAPIAPKIATRRNEAVASAFRQGLPLSNSIDNFLHSRSDNQDIVDFGKAAIAYLILEAESRSDLMRNENGGLPPAATGRLASLAYTELSKTWYFSLAKLLFDGCQVNDLRQNLGRVKFVIFNYDRCVEQFLWLALQARYELSSTEAAEIIASIEFVHPYGSLGPLPWQSHDGALRYGVQNFERSDVFDVSKNLRTFTEATNEQVKAQIHGAMNSSSTLCFLGFGFLKENVALLRTKNMQAEMILATSYGFHSTENEIVQAGLRQFRKQYSTAEPFVSPDKCSDFFQTVWQRLSSR